MWKIVESCITIIFYRFFNERQALTHDWVVNRHYGRHKSGLSESRGRHERARNRHGKSEEPPAVNNLNTLNNNNNDPPTPTDGISSALITSAAALAILGGNGVLASAEDDPAIAEREAKRKEIQGLIMKYTDIEELSNNGPVMTKSDAIASKYQKRNINHNSNHNSINSKKFFKEKNNNNKVVKLVDHNVENLVAKIEGGPKPKKPVKKVTKEESKEPKEPVSKNKSLKKSVTYHISDKSHTQILLLIFFFLITR